MGAIESCSDGTSTEVTLFQERSYETDSKPPFLIVFGKSNTIQTCSLKPACVELDYIEGWDFSALVRGMGEDRSPEV